MKYYQFVIPLSRKVFGTNGNVALTNYEEYEKKLATIENFHNCQYLTFRLLQGHEDKIFVPEYKEKGSSSKITNLLWIDGEIQDLCFDDNLKITIFNSFHFGLLFFETSLIYKGSNPLKYWYVIPRHEGSQFIDFEKTLLEDQSSIENMEWVNSKFLNHNDYTSYELKTKKLLHKKNLTIIDNCDCDFFALSNVFNRPVGYIVSERLREKIEKEKMTGMQFLEFDSKWP